MSESERTPVNILLVDDRPENLEALKAILDNPEYRLFTATSGTEALRLALREEFALIVLDVQALLAEVTGILSESLDHRTTLPKVAKCVVPSLGDWCLIDEVLDRGVLRELAVAHVDPAREAWVRGLGRERSLDLSAPVGIGHAVATQRAQLHQAVPDLQWMAAALCVAEEETLPPVGASSCMLVPLITRERVIGVITFVSCSRRRFGSADLALAEEVGRRVALSMENAFLYEAAHRAIRAREQLLAVVSHDLLNPLNSVVISAGRIEQEAARAEDGERLRRSARLILRSTQRMHRLIGDLLDFSRLESGHLKVECRSVHAKALLDEILETLRPAATEKGLRLESEATEGLVAHCDRERTLQVLSNLVGNAVKFTSTGGSVRVRAERRGSEVWFSISDTGPGIPENELPRVWERFWRSRRAAEEGVGLGLAIAKGLVEAQDGRIWVESEVGDGTKFHFTLPLEDGSTARETSPDDRPPMRVDEPARHPEEPPQSAESGGS